MLEMQGISKIYRTDLIETHALRDFSLTVNAGEFVAVTGPSGSGKSSLMAMVGGLSRPSDGTVMIDGTDIRRYTMKSVRDQISFDRQLKFLVHAQR